MLCAKFSVPDMMHAYFSIRLPVALALWAPIWRTNWWWMVTRWPWWTTSSQGGKETWSTGLATKTLNSLIMMWWSLFTLKVMGFQTFDIFYLGPSFYPGPSIYLVSTNEYSSITSTHFLKKLKALNSSRPKIGWICFGHAADFHKMKSQSQTDLQYEALKMPKNKYRNWVWFSLETVRWD